MKDQEFLADAARMRVDVSPLLGEDVLARIEKLANAPAEQLDYFRKLHAQNKGD
jgi:hypothetical protein